MVHPARDRLVAAVVACTGALGLLVTVAFVDAPPWPTHRPVANDPAALAELVALLDARDDATYLVEFASTRTLADGRVRADTVVEAQRPPVRVVVGGSAATVEIGDRRFRCTETDGLPGCLEEPGRADGLATARVYEVAVRHGFYAVRRAAARTIAGERATCFEIVAVTGELPGLGLVGEQCFAADGVPLAARVAGAQAVDERTAVTVRRTATSDELAALIDRFGAATEPGGAG